MISITASADTRALRRGGARLAGELAKIVAESAFEVEARAKVGAPVDTGALRASIYTRTFRSSGYSTAVGVSRGLRPGRSAHRAPQPKSPMEAFVAAGVSYAVFVEYGARGRPARHFMGRALRSVAPRFRARVRRAMMQVGRP